MARVRVWFIPSIVAIVPEDKSAEISGELLDAVNVLIFELLDKKLPETFKAIYCLSDLAQTFGSRLVPVSNALNKKSFFNSQH